MSEPRAFAVCLYDAPGGVRRIAEASVEAAALAFAEDCHPVPDDGGAVRIVVRDEETGREICLRVDLGSGAAAPCG